MGRQFSRVLVHRVTYQIRWPVRKRLLLSFRDTRYSTPCSQLPVFCLPEIRLVWVVEIGLEVAEHWRHRIEPVVGNRHGLRVAQLRKRLHIEPIIALLVVGLRLDEIGPVGLSFARQETDVRIVAGFGKVIANLELVFLATKLAGNPRGKVIRKGKKNLRAEGLQKRAPGLTR